MAKKLKDPHRPSNPRSQWKKEEEFTLCGWNACMLAFERRPTDIRRFFFSKERSSSVGAIKKWCSEHKLPYRELDAESLNKVAGSLHHEGIVLVVRPVRMENIHTLVERGLPQDGLLVALDRVGNVHNVGAILRSCAYFGATGLLIALKEGQALMTPAAARTAEGAMELVPVYECPDLPSALRDLRARKIFVLGTDPTAERSLHEVELTFPCVVALGNEHEGLSEQVKGRCDALVRIPGSSKPSLQSLNVSVAAGVILAELRRRQALNPKSKVEHGLDRKSLNSDKSNLPSRSGRGPR